MKRKRNFERLGTLPIFLCFLCLASVVVPLIIVVVTSFNATAELAFPPNRFSFKWFVNIFTGTNFLSGVKFSLSIAFVVSILAPFVGMLLALALIRYRFFGRSLINLLVFTPLIIPEVVTGIALLLFFVKLGSYNSWLNITILHVILAIPYTVRVLMASLYRFDITLEEAAKSLGANQFWTFRKITFPLIKPGLIAAWLFAFVVSFNNFTATLFLVSRKSTLPIEIYSYIRTQNDPTVSAVSTLLILTTVFFVMAAAKYVGLEKFTK